jgi:glycosyltransferase involved in cell wall biosynthesis
MTGVSVTVVMPVYNGERYIAEALTAVLSQTRPADEVIVVDDGCTDDTLGELAPFRNAMHLVRQSNRGHPAAYNTGFSRARCDYVARCDADDVWTLDKLERQCAALDRHPGIGIAAGAARNVTGSGQDFGAFSTPERHGLLEHRWLVASLYRASWLCASSVVVKRDLFEHLGPFTDGLLCEDYEYWLRAAGAGALFFYDSAVVVNYRRHESNVSNDNLAMARAVRLAHRRHAGLVADPRFVRRILAEDSCRVGGLLLDDQPDGARDEFVGALRHRLAPRQLTWATVLSLPAGGQDRLIPALQSLKSARRAMSTRRPVVGSSPP